MATRRAPSRSAAPAAPRVPLADPAETDAAAGWDELGIGGEFDSVRLTGAPGLPELSDVVWRDCVLARVELGGTDLVRARFEGCTLSGVDAAELAASCSHWRHTTVRQLRAGVVDLVASHLQAVRLSGARLGRLDLRRAKVADLLIEDASIDELDLEEANATRVAFRDVRIGRLLVAGAALRDVDLRGARLESVGPVQALRGAVISEWQLQALAPAFAAELGLRVLGGE